MNKLLLLGFSASYAAFSLHAALAVDQISTQTLEVSGPAVSVEAPNRALPHPGNFDASLTPGTDTDRHRLMAKPGALGRPDTRLAMPKTIHGKRRYARTRSAGILSSHYDQQLDRPTFLWAGEEAGNSFDFYAYKRGEGAISYAQAYLKQFANRLQITPRAIDQAALVFLHDDGAGPVIARFQQQVNGIDVMNRQLNVVMNQALELVAISGYFATAKAAYNRDFSGAFRSGPTRAMNTMFNDLGIGVSAYNLYDTTRTKGGFSQYAPLAGSTASLKSTGGIQLTAPVGAKKVLFPVDGKLVPGWLMTVQAGQTGRQHSLAYFYVAGADSNRVLYRKDLVAHDSYQYRVFADAVTKRPDDSPFGNSLLPYPGSPVTPVFGDGTLVTVSVASQGITDAWLPLPVAGANLTITQGNNVFAYADVAGEDGKDTPQDVYGSTTAPGVFNYIIDPTTQPDNLTNQQAGIVNLFYLNNWLHDSWYNAGFTEIAGNAQFSNYGRGGVEGDPILAESQDFSGRNNANMLTGPDGFAPRMQMYIFDGPIESQITQATSSGGTGPFVFDPAAPAFFGPVEFDITAELAIYNDGDASGTGINGELDACQPTTQDLTGKIALIGDIYTCQFDTKVANAEAAGAIGALIVYNGAPNPDQVFLMGSDGSPVVTIPSLSVSDDDANPVMADIQAGNTVTLHMLVDKAPNRDGSLDSQVVAHEFFHYVSNRLVGNASGLSNFQGAGMGEGWSDVAGLLLSVRPDDLANQPAGLYTIGGFDVANFLYGIRRLPYTTNMAFNPLTFKYIQNGVPLPPASIPYAFGASGANNFQVHNIGEIWVLPLWEAYVGLYQYYKTINPATAFATAKSQMQNYIVEGLMATPNAPTMIEARDAILAAVLATTPANDTEYDIFVAAFAKRGMGFGAIAPPRGSTDGSGVVESFATDLKIYALDNAVIDTNFAAGTCDADFTLDPGETGQLTLRISNIGSADLSGVTAQLSSTSDISFANGGLVEFDTVDMFGGESTATTTFTVNSATMTSEVMTVNIAFPDVGSDPAAVTEPDDIQLQFVSNQDYVATLTADNMENAAKSHFDWTTTAVGADLDGWVIDNTFSAPLGLPADNDYWYGVDSGAPGITTLVTPTMVVGDAPFSVSFYHYYQFETGSGTHFDGGVMEVSINGGIWQDVTAAGGTFAFGYNGVINVTGFGNPLEGRDAFVNFGGTIVDGAPESISFGTALAGDTVQFRFVIGTDAAVGELGWIVDDVTVSGAAAPMFSSVEPEDNVCIQVPEADAGAPQTVSAGTVVTLHGSASDPQNGELSYSWTQTGGPSVSLNNADTLTPTFTAPFVNDTLAFELTVTDTLGNIASDTTTVTVNDTPPDADAGKPQLVNSETVVTLDGAGSSDAEGSLAYSWTQVGGVNVTLSDPTSVTPTFTAPDDVTSVLRFKLTVTDQAGQTDVDRAVVILIDADDDDWWWQWLKWLWDLRH